jgi:D-inositol-3-phosphate glycosyltransferase
VVAAAVGGLTTLVDHGVTGYLIEVREPRSSADCVARILEDNELATRMSARATARARGYTWSVAAGRLRRLYADLTARQLVQCP